LNVSLTLLKSFDIEKNVYHEWKREEEERKSLKDFF